MKITKRQLRRIIREEKARILKEQKPSEMSMHDAAEYYASSKSDNPPASTDAIILADDFIQAAVFDGLEELGVTAEQADAIIRQLYNRPDKLKEALTNGLYDYKRKLGMTGKPKPRSI